MSVGEKIEKFVFDTNWSAIGKKIKKTIVYMHDKVEEQRNNYYTRKIKENEEKQKGNKDV